MSSTILRKFCFDIQVRVQFAQLGTNKGPKQSIFELNTGRLAV